MNNAEQFQVKLLALLQDAGAKAREEIKFEEDGVKSYQTILVFPDGSEMVDGAIMEILEDMVGG